MKKSYLIITLVLCLAFVLGACGGGEAAKPTPTPEATQAATATPEPTPEPHTDEYLVRMLTFPDSLDYGYTGTGTVAYDLTAQIFESLIYTFRNNPTDRRGGIAESWTSEVLEGAGEDAEGNAINLFKYTFKIRKGVTFSTGEAMTLDDIVWTYNRWKDAPNSAANAAIFESIEKDEAAYTVAITVNTASPYAILTFGTVGILDEDVLGGDYDPILQVANTPELVVGTGAYKLTEWKQDESITFEANENWWGKDVYRGGTDVEIKKVKYIVIADANAAMIAFENKEITGLSITTPEDIDKYLKLEADARAKGEIPEVRVTYSQSAARLGIAFNMNDPVVGCQGDAFTAEQQEAALNLRKAIWASVDRDAVNEVCYAGRGVMVDQLTNPYTEGYVENPDWFIPYDVDAAKDYLAKSGFDTTQSLSFTYISDDQYSIGLATVVQEACRVIGLTVELDGYDQPTWFNHLYEQPDGFQMAYNSYTPTWNNPSVAYSSPYKSGNYWNPWKYANARVDELWTLAQYERDDAKRIEYYTELNTIASSSLCFLPLIGSRSVSVNNGNWCGFYTDGVSATAPWWAIFWDEDGLWSYAEDGYYWE